MGTLCNSYLLRIHIFHLLNFQNDESCSKPSQSLLRISWWTRETFTFKSSPLLIWNPVRISHKFCPSSKSILWRGKLVKCVPLTATLKSLSVNASAILNCWLTSNGNAVETTSESPQLSLKRKERIDENQIRHSIIGFIKINNKKLITHHRHASCWQHILLNRIVDWSVSIDEFCHFHRKIQWIHHLDCQ